MDLALALHPLDDWTLRSTLIRSTQMWISIFFSVKAKHMGCKVRVTHAVLQLFSASLMGGICGIEVMFLRISDSWIQSIGLEKTKNRTPEKSREKTCVFYIFFHVKYFSQDFCRVSEVVKLLEGLKVPSTEKAPLRMKFCAIAASWWMRADESHGF